MNAVLMVLLPIIMFGVALMSNIGLLPFIPPMLFFVLTFGISYSALKNRGRRKTTVAVYLNLFLLVLGAWAAAETPLYLPSHVNAIGMDIGVLAGIAINLAPFIVNLRSLAQSRKAMNARDLNYLNDTKIGATSHVIQKKRWALILGIILSTIWIAHVFNGRAEENKQIRKDATAQLTYNSAYEIFQKVLPDMVEKWAIKTCAYYVYQSGLDENWEKACVRQAVQEHRGLGYPNHTELCSLIANAKHTVGLVEPPYDQLAQAVREVIHQDACVLEEPSAPVKEKPISDYLPKALLPPISFAIVIWGIFAIYSRVRRSLLARSISESGFRLKIRIGLATLLIYEFWLGVWVIFIAHSSGGRWVYNSDWLLDWLALAAIVPAGLLMSFLAYQWATAQKA